MKNNYLFFAQYTLPTIIVVSLFLMLVLMADKLPSILLVGLLFLPLLDKAWVLPRIKPEKRSVLYSCSCLCIIIVLLVVNPEIIKYTLMTIFFVALPEEWFFRAYLLTRLQTIKPEQKLAANIISSLVFSLLHAITRGALIAIEVFVPSLLFGWFYQKTNDLLLCILLHTISNMIFVLYLNQHIYIVRDFISDLI